MNAKAIEKHKSNFVSAKIMNETDNIIAEATATYADEILFFNMWQRGWSFYTEEKVIVTAGLLTCVDVPYTTITKIEKCTQFFLPLGIKLYYTEESTGKTRTLKYSTQKRDKYIEMIESKSQVKCS